MSETELKTSDGEQPVEIEFTLRIPRTALLGLGQALAVSAQRAADGADEPLAS